MIKKQGIFPLPVKVPPMLEQVLGYPGRLHRPGEALPRYVAFYWTEGGDEASFSDGRTSSTGMMNNEAYLSFVGHRAVKPYLADYNLGASDAEASHWLVLDRDEPRQLYVALAPAAYRLLQQQWGDTPQEVAPLQVKDMAELEQLVTDALNMSSWTEVTSGGSTADVMRMLQEEQQRKQELEAWLDANA